MTTTQSTTRLVLYVAISMVTASSAGVLLTDFTNPKQVAIFALSVLATGLNTARSYIDKSPGQVDPPKDQP